MELLRYTLSIHGSFLLPLVNYLPLAYKLTAGAALLSFGREADTKKKIGESKRNEQAKKWLGEIYKSSISARDSHSIYFLYVSSSLFFFLLFNIDTSDAGARMQQHNEQHWHKRWWKPFSKSTPVHLPLLIQAAPLQNASIARQLPT